MQDTLPDKLYFKIGEVAKYADVATHVIRYWESEFDEISPSRAHSKQRLFKRDDVLLILRIKDLLHTRGYTIAGAKKALKDTSDVGSSHMEEKLNLPLCTDMKKQQQEMLRTLKKELLDIQEILR